jgi:hypothetical protein
MQDKNSRFALQGEQILYPVGIVARILFGEESTAQNQVAGGRINAQPDIDIEL